MTAGHDRNKMLHMALMINDALPENAAATIEVNERSGIRVHLIAGEPMAAADDLGLQMTTTDANPYGATSIAVHRTWSGKHEHDYVEAVVTLASVEIMPAISTCYAEGCPGHEAGRGRVCPGNAVTEMAAVGADQDRLKPPVTRLSR